MEYRDLSQSVRRRALQARGGERGDTLVEVLMSIVILSFIIVGAITLMTRGLSAIQVASEHTQVRLQVNAQGELLRRMRDAYQVNEGSALGQQWSSLFAASPNYANTTASSNGGACAVSSGKTPFYIRQQTGSLHITQFDSTIVPPAAAVPGQGMWIEATRSPVGITPGYVDFQFRACWDAAGAAADQQQVLTVMRLYDPAH